MVARCVALVVLLLAAALPAFADPLPERLADTGFGAPDAIAFEPAYPLWSDGTRKQRWIRLPPGTSIDASDPDAWRFPRGTKLWKTFAYGSRIETRYVALDADGRWSFGTYVWNADGSDARLAPARGIARLPVADAPDGVWPIPSQSDCETCHGGARTPVLGFGALQLPGLLPELVRRGLVRNAPAAWRERGPVISAATETERAARGHLHANCGHCHHERGAPVPLVLAQRIGGTPAPEPDRLETARQRMSTRDPLRQMPPLGTRVVDAAGLATVEAWLATMTSPRLATTKEP